MDSLASTPANTPRKASGQLRRTPSTRFIAADAPQARPHQPVRHTIATVLLRTEIGRERLARAVQMIVRTIVCIRARNEKTRDSNVTKSMLVVVGLLSASRKLHTLLSTLLVYFAPAERKAKLLIELETIEGAKGPLEAALAAIQDIADSVSLFGMLVPRRIGLKQRGDRLADRAWLALSLLQLSRVSRERALVYARGVAERKVLIDLTSPTSLAGSSLATPQAETPYALDDLQRERVRQARRTLRALRAQRQGLTVERYRLAADAIFAAYDTLDVRAGSELVRLVSGLVSAAVGMVQVLRASQAPHPLHIPL